MKTTRDPRHEARRLALNKIYTIDVGGSEAENSLLCEFLEIKKYNEELLTKILTAYQENKEELDEKIKDKIATWNQDQLIDLDLIIIKIAILEFLILKITPVKVAVDEAVELSKEFGGDKSSKFVNGVLAKVIENEKL
ncbi:transcription antitermination factor NusB [Patescibacteria group bacterium]|nr:transcription antitermination factor NusB [Patescibacteria group bacterium]